MPHLAKAFYGMMHRDRPILALILQCSVELSSYKTRIAQYRQNLQIQSNQKRFCQSINEDTARNQPKPEKIETVLF